jgi:t-SNARE complex subunit (syntaxin)
MTTASDFQRLHNAILTNLTKITNNTTDLEKLVEKLGTPEDSEPLRDRYHRLQNDTKVLMQQTNEALQQLNNASVLTEADQRRKKDLTTSLPNQYMATLTRFQRAQQMGARKEKESLDRARAISFRQQGLSDAPFSDNFVSTSGTAGLYQQQAVLAVEKEVDLRGLQERDTQLREVESNIREVNELFKDVAKLVHDQDTVIDSIDRHIMDTEVNVVSGTEHLTKAVTYQSASRRKKIRLIAILLIVVIIIVLVLVFTLKK